MTEAKKLQTQILNIQETHIIKVFNDTIFDSEVKNFGYDRSAILNFESFVS